MARSSLFLQCGTKVDSVIRSRVAYAFRVFAAIYDYQVVEKAEAAEFCCVYGDGGTDLPNKRVLRIPARYRPRPKSAGMPSLKRFHHANEDLYLVHGVDGATGNPDWLGEIFEWLSSSLELPIPSRDAVGRIPYSETVFERQGLSPLKPHAALLMAWMENVLQNGGGVESLPKAVSPLPGVEHMVVCSHDIDFYFTDRATALQRLSKNLGISLAQYRSASYFMANSRMILGLLRGKRPGDYVPRMLSAIEDCGFRSTLFAVAHGEHRRDPIYKINQVAPQLRDAARRGFSVGVHASYSSVIEKGSLPQEAAALEQAVSQRPLGSRQHWLRFDRHDKLFQAVERARLAYDSSLGFAETCGFRNGASFAFPPYDFDKEGPCSFLEIPLVIMDGSLEAMSRTLRRTPQALADTVLSESRTWGWGGIGILWHNPMEAIQVPDEVNHVFWECAKKRKRYAEQWMSAEEFIAVSLGRYQAAGLLKGIRFDA